jgi:hypothetical protein
MEARRAISEKKLQANRANAKRSTGPRTQAGKAAVRRNALKHGVLSSSVGVLSDECLEHLNAVLSSLKKTRDPQTIEDGYAVGRNRLLVAEVGAGSAAGT